MRKPRLLRQSVWRIPTLAALAAVVLSVLTAGAAEPSSVVVLVAHYSRTGQTAAMARAVEEGARSVAGTTVVSKTVDHVTEADLMGADAIIVGSPVYNAGMAADVKAFLDRWPFGKLKDKVGAAFCTGGGTSAGEELTLTSILHAMLIFQFVIVGGDSWQAAFGASAVTEEGKPADKRGVDEAALAKARGLGVRVARYAHIIAAGRR